MQEPQGCKDCAETLSLSTFYYEAHQCIYDACRKLYNAGIPPDVVAVTSELRERGNLDAAGGESYLYQILAAVPNASAIEAHAFILREKAALRELISACNDCISLAYQPGEDTKVPFSFIEKRLTAISRNESADMIIGMDAAIRLMMDSYTQAVVDGQSVLIGPKAIDTGFADWDKYFGGFQRGELAVISALPGGGKSSLAWYLMQQWAKSGLRCLLFSTEMTAAALARRALASHTGISNRKLKEGNFSVEELERLQEGYCVLGELSLHLTDRGRMTVTELVNRARAFSRQHRLDVVCVDYIQELKWTRDSERESLMETCAELKSFASEDGLLAIGVSQWNKAGKREAQQEGKASLANLHGAGIENTADRVISLYPQEEEGLPSSRRTIKVSMDKNRDGAVGSIRLILDAPTQAWYDDAAQPNTQEATI
jgi:replicative DNA helicase